MNQVEGTWKEGKVSLGSTVGCVYMPPDSTCGTVMDMIGSRRMCWALESRDSTIRGFQCWNW